MRKSLKVALVVCVPLLGSCTDIAVDGPRPLDLELTASSTSTTPGESVEFSFSATGALLFSVILDYGDGSTEQFPGSGAQTMSGRRTHAWEEVGTYRVVCRLEDSSLGSITREVTIQVATP